MKYRTKNWMMTNYVTMFINVYFLRLVQPDCSSFWKKKILIPCLSAYIPQHEVYTDKRKMSNVWTLLVQLYDFVTHLVIILRISIRESKEMSLCYKLWFSNFYLCNPISYILDISTYEFLLDQNSSLKYQRFTPSGCKDIWD